MEVGPWRMHEDGQLYVEEGGWEEYTNIVYSACSRSSPHFYAQQSGS